MDPEQHAADGYVLFTQPVIVGAADGAADGAAVVGVAVGTRVGTADGCAVGVALGMAVGVAVGIAVVGAALVGIMLGASDTKSTTLQLPFTGLYTDAFSPGTTSSVPAAVPLLPHGPLPDDPPNAFVPICVITADRNWIVAFVRKEPSKAPSPTYVTVSAIVKAPDS